jgi:hypothetical protein
VRRDLPSAVRTPAQPLMSSAALLLCAPPEHRHAPASPPPAPRARAPAGRPAPRLPLRAAPPQQAAPASAVLLPRAGTETAQNHPERMNIPAATSFLREIRSLRCVPGVS